MTQENLRKLLLAASAAGLAVTGCASKPTPEQMLVEELIKQKNLLPATEEEKAEIAKQDLLTQAAFWGDQHERNPSDQEAAYNFSRVLRLIGSSRRSSEIAAQALAMHPGDKELSTVLAKAAMDQGRPDSASNVLFQAINMNEPDWEMLSLYGVTLDQIGEHELAQTQYERALEISPNNSVVMANKALSLALQGDVVKAESILRTALDADEKPDPRVRQNLALVLGLQGRIDEARTLTAEDLPPTIVSSNIEYYRSLLNPSRNWGDLRGATQDDEFSG